MLGSKPYARDCKPGLPGCKMLIATCTGMLCAILATDMVGYSLLMGED